MTLRLLLHFFSISVFAIGVLIAAISPWFSINRNQSNSLPDLVYLIHKDSTFKKGDLIAYRWQGGVHYPAGSIFTKRVVGMPGDTVERVGSEFWVNKKYIGLAKPKSTSGVVLEPAQAGVIQAGSYFVATPHPDSLDSRYAITGNVAQAQVVGKAYAIF